MAIHINICVYVCVCVELEVRNKGQGTMDTLYCESSMRTSHTQYKHIGEYNERRQRISQIMFASIATPGDAGPQSIRFGLCN